MANRFKIGWFVPGPTTDASRIDAYLASLDEQDVLAPTHASYDERTSKPYDRAALVDAYEDQFLPAGVQLWRRKAPRYEGSLVTTDAEFVDMSLLSQSDVDGLVFQSVYEAASKVASQTAPAFGYVLPGWDANPSAFETGISNSREFFRYGFRTGYPRMWFGPGLPSEMDAFLDDVLNAFPNQKLENGVVQVDLADAPWTLDLDGYLATREPFDNLLQEHEFVADFTVFFNPTAGSGWTPPQWV